MKRALSLVFTTLLLGNTLVFAQGRQTLDLNNYQVPQKRFKITRTDIAPAARRPEQTITAWAEKAVQTHSVNAKELLRILKDKDYIQSDNVYTEDSCLSSYRGPLACEFNLLTSSLPHLDFSPAEAAALTEFLTGELLRPYNKADKDYELYFRYSLIAAAVAPNSSAGRDMLAALLKTVTSDEVNIKVSSQVWSARALAEVPYLSRAQQRMVAAALEPEIKRMSDILKDEIDDKHGPGLMLPNQYVAKKNFSQKISFFAQLNLASAIIDKPMWLSYDMPGMDGKSFETSKNGHRHNKAFNLIRTLFNSYVLSGQPENMNYFIIKYGKLDTHKKDFQNYLTFALYGLDMAFEYQDGRYIEGWEDQYGLFINALRKNLGEWSCTTFAASLQGGMEFAAEWEAVALVFATGGKALKGLSSLGKIGFFRFMPNAAFKSYNFLFITLPEHHKALSRIYGKNAKNFIKTAAVFTAGAALSGDTNTAVSAQRPKNITMDEKEINRFMGAE